MIIRNNLLSINISRQLGLNETLQNKSIEKLSTGYRINRAADDAAHLTISEKMRSQIRGLNQASSNMQNAISLLQTADGALSTMQSLVQRMRELSVQASNDTNTIIDRTMIQTELDEMIQEIDRISTTTEFNTIKLFNGTLKSVSPSHSTVLMSTTHEPTLTLTQALNSIPSDQIGIFFTDESDYTTIQSTEGNPTSLAYGTYIIDTLQTSLVPQAVQSILNTYSGAFSYLTGSSVGIGLRLYSDTSSTLASVTCGGGSGAVDFLSFSLAVNVNSLSFSGGVLTEDSRKDLEATIAHEMIHALMDEALTAGMLGYNGTAAVTSFPKWFKEGTAQTANGGADWVTYGLGINAASSDATIKSALSTLTSNTNAANYGVGYLACMYLGYLANGDTGAVNATNIRHGMDIIFQSLVSGNSLDKTIADYTKYTGFSDFTSNLANDSAAFSFVRNLMTAIGSGRGSVISGNLTDTDLLANTQITTLDLFRLNTTYDFVKNIYPSDVNVFSGGATSASGTKPVSTAPDAPPVGGGTTPTSTIINLSDLTNVNFAGISGVVYNAATKTITITGNGTYEFTGNNADINIVVNSGITANINSDHTTCKSIYGNNGSSLTIHGQLTTINGISGGTSLVNYGLITGNIQDATVTNNGTINGNLNVSGVTNNTGATINGNVTENGNMILNHGIITGTCTGTVRHYVSSFSKSITTPSAVNTGQALPSSASLSSTITANYNGTSTTLTGTWEVKDKNGNVVSDPTAITMNEGDSYTYTLQFDGSAYDMYFSSASTSALLTATSEATTPDGAAISTSGSSITYTFTLTSGLVSSGATSGDTTSTTGGLAIQMGAGSGQGIRLYFNNMSSTDLGINAIQVNSHQNAAQAITNCDNANTSISNLRSYIGAYQNRFQHAIKNADNMSENLQAAESRMRDLDMAEELLQYSKRNILIQVSQSLLAQANQLPQNVLNLLK